MTDQIVIKPTLDPAGAILLFYTVLSEKLGRTPHGLDFHNLFRDGLRRGVFPDELRPPLQKAIRNAVHYHALHGLEEAGYLTHPAVEWRMTPAGHEQAERVRGSTAYSLKDLRQMVEATFASRVTPEPDPPVADGDTVVGLKFGDVEGYVTWHDDEVRSRIVGDLDPNDIDTSEGG